MIRSITGAVTLSLMATTALAGGIDRSRQNVSAIFNEPGTASFSAGVITPRVTGTDSLGNAVDVAPSYTQVGASYVLGLSEGFSLGFIYDQPFGADILYGGSPSTTRLGGTEGRVESQALSILGKYELNNNFSVFGGLRVQSASAEVKLNGLANAGGLSVAGVARQIGAAIVAGGGTPPSNLATLVGGTVSTDATTAATARAAIDALAVTGFTGAGTAAAVGAAIPTFLASGGYTASLGADTGAGYTIGAAYEIPEIALRAALTYHSRIEHSFATNESLPVPGSTAGASTTTAFTPQSVNLDFQTGIAEDTLLTASVRWVDWDQTQIVPAGLGSSLTNFESGFDYTLGVARRFNENFSGSITLNYEAEGDGSVGSALVPSSGRYGVTVGGRYTKDNVSISGGINYSELGDARVGVGGVQDASFSNNSLIGVGFNVEIKM